MPDYQSGKFAAVNGVGSIYNWNLQQSKPAEIVRHSATKGGTARNPGINDYTGSYQGAGGKPVVLPGEAFSFKGYVGSNTGSLSGAGPTYAVAAMCSSVVIVWDFTTRKLIRHTVNFGSTGAMTHVAADTAVVDSSTPIIAPISSLPAAPFIYGAVPTTITSIKTATLTLTEELNVVANSDTGANKGRKRGVFDWTLAIETERGDVQLASDLILDALKCFVNATEFWLLDYGMVGESTNIKADAESGAMAAQTINIAMTAYKADGTIGSVTKPGGLSAYWPEA